ncbi:MAG: hypothetical protein QGG87_04780 [Nitrospinota bacterium]|nr:hypothetical protein [Nitrospinota bacterium]
MSTIPIPEVDKVSVTGALEHSGDRQVLHFIFNGIIEQINESA